MTGLITDLENHPIANANVRLLNRQESKRQSTQTDEEGVFTLTGVPGDVGPRAFYVQPPLETNDSGGVTIRGLATQSPLHVELAMQVKGFASQTGTLELSEATNVANFALAPGKVFRGRVRDEAGNPIPHAVVRTDYDFRNQLQTPFDWTTQTDINGLFEWDSAPEQEICYWFEADGYEVIRGQPLLANGIDHEIMLKAKAAK